MTLCTHCKYFESTFREDLKGNMKPTYVCHHPEYWQSVWKYRDENGDRVTPTLVRSLLGAIVDHRPGDGDKPNELPWCPLHTNSEKRESVCSVLTEIAANNPEKSI